MIKKPTLQSIAAKMNPESLVYDRHANRFVRIPASLPPFPEVPENSQITHLTLQPCIKFIPELNSEQVFQTPLSTEIVNTTGKNIKFVSEHTFNSGVHEIELLNYVSFKNIKLKALHTNSKGKLSEFVLNLDAFSLDTSLIVKLDVYNKRLSVHSPSSLKKSDCSLKGSKFRLAIEFKSIGDFVSVNPLLLVRGVNNIWTFNNRILSSKYIELSKNWIFLNNVDGTTDGVLTGLLKEVAGVEADGKNSQDIIFDSASKIAAIRVAADRLKEARKVAKGKSEIPSATLKSVLRLVYQGLPFDQQLQNTELIDFVTKHKETFVAVPRERNLIKLAEKITTHEPTAIETTYNAAPGIAKAEYLDSQESLLLFNGVNKLKVVSERSGKREFVVSPFIFDTSRVNFSLSQAEYKLLFKSLDWKDLAERLKLPADESQSLEKAMEALLSDKNLVTDGEYYHFGLDSVLVHSLVWRAFEYVNLIIESAYPHELLEDDVDKNCLADQSPSEKTKVDDLGGSELIDLFNEDKHKTRVSDLSIKPLKNHLDSFFNNNFEHFPTEFDGILSVLFKVEEALFLQSAAYRKAAKVISRSHTALSRLFSFVASPLPMSQIKRLVDFGIYINSAFVNEFKHFRHEKCAYNDFNDQNVAEIALKAYAMQKLNPHSGVVPKDNISLAFSISHMPAWTCSDKIDRVFVLKEGKFVGVLTESKVLHLLSTQFGLVELFKTNLGSPVSWTAPKTFEGLIKNDIADIKDIEPKEPEIPQTGADKQATDAASGKKSEAAQPPPPPPKPEEMDKVVDKGMLDMLYNMGFPLDLCKKALYDVKSSSFEDALNQVFKLKEENLEVVGPVKKKVMHMQLKPEWECKVCTLVNVVDFTSQTPDVCDACGNVADQDAYFEEEEEEIITEPQVEPERQFKSEETLEPTDYVLSMEFVSLKKDNLLHKYFLVLAVRRLDKVHLLVSRLAIAESLIKHMALQDPVSKGFVSWPGFNLLKRGLVERDLGFNFSQFYEEKILAILAFSLTKDVYVETSRKQFAIEMKDEVKSVFVNQHTNLNARGSEELFVYASGAKLTQIIALTNKSRSYCVNEFDIQLSETLEASDLKILTGVSDQLLLAISGNTVTGYTTKLQQTGAQSEIGEHTRILSVTTTQLTVLHSDGRVSKVPLAINEFQVANEHYHKALGLLRFKQDANQQDDFISPQILLSFFKTQSSISFKPSKLRNCYKQLPTNDNIFSLRFAPIDPKADSAIELRKIAQDEGCNINVDIYIKAPKNTAEIQNFITEPLNKDTRHRKTFSNSYTKLELRCISFGGNPFSKSVHFSQMLSNDGEYFATKTPFNLFVFESIFERIMKVKKVILELSANMLTNSIIDEVLVFVFSDLSLLNSMNGLSDLSLLTVESAIKNGSLLPGIEPCMRLSLKKDGGCKVSEELELAQVGKYIAFLPLKGGAVANASAKPLDCFQYFAVEGDYSTDQSLESLSLSCFSGDLSSNTHGFQGYSVKVTRDGKEEQLNSFKIVAVQETKSDTIAKLRGTLSLLGKVDRLDVHLPSSVNNITPLSVQMTLSKISHSLIMKIKEQMNAGSSEKLTTIFNQYNDKILGVDAENQTNFESNYLNLIDLLLFVLETFGAKMVGPVLKIDFRRIMSSCVLNSKESKIIGASRFLLEKLFSFPETNEHFKAIFFEVLKDLPKVGLTYEGLEAFWKLLANFVQATSPTIKEQVLKEISGHINKVVSRTEALNTPNNMLLRSLSIWDTLNLMPVFKAEAIASDSKTDKNTGVSVTNSNQKSNLVETVDNSTLVEYNGQSYHDKNYAEYLINCTELIKLDQVLIRFPKIKPLLSTALEVQVFNAETECFEVVKLKQLRSDFSNYLSAKDLSADPASLRHYHLGLSFVNYDKPVKLLRIVSRVNHIPVFDYTENDSTQYEFFIHGTKIETILTKAEIGEEEKKQVDNGMIQLYTTRCNQRYASYNDEVSAVQNVKVKIREWISSVVYLKAKSVQSTQEADASVAKTEKGQADTPAGIEVKDTIDALNRLKETIEDQLQGIEVADFRPNSPIRNAISSEADQYRSILESKKSKLSQTALSDNLTFWLADLDMFVAEFSKIVAEKDNFQMLFNSGASAEEVLARIFFDGLFFEKSDKALAIQTFLSDSIKLMGQDEPLKMLNKLCAIYQSFGNAVFVSNLDKFMDILNALKLTTIENWTAIVHRIVHYTDKRPEDLSQEELKKLLLDANLLNMASIDQSPFSNELFFEVEKITVWMLSNKLEVVNKKFEEITLLLLGQMFKAIAPEQTGDIEISSDALKKIFELTALNGMLPKVDKIIADFVRLVAKVQPKSPDSKRFRGLMNLLKMTLMGFITEQVVESDAAQLYGSEKVSQILFFALSQIKAMDEVQNSLAGEKEEEVVKQSSLPTPTPIPVIQPVSKDQPMAPLPKKSTKLERSNSLIQVTPESDPVLSLFVNDILKFMNSRNIQDIGLISIITNFTITEHMSPQLLIGVTRFAISQPKEVRQTIIQDLGLKVADIHKKLKTGKSKVAIREFSSLTLELVIDLLKNHLSVVAEDITVAHFAITLTLHLIHENEPKVVAIEYCKLPLRPHLAAPLLTVVANLLAERFNFGGPENFQNFPDTDLNLFELLTNCLHILLRGVDDSGSTLLTFLVQNFKTLRESTAGETSELDTALESLSIWLLCNYTATFPELKSVVGPLLKKVHSDAVLVMTELFTKEEAAKVLLNSVCSNFRRLNSVLTRRVEKRTIGYLGLYMNENSIDFLEWVLKITAENEILANHFLLANKGLELIFEILHRSNGETQSPAIESAQRDSLLAQMRKATRLPANKLSTDPAKTIISPNKDKAIFEEEFGTRITNIQIDKSISSGTAVKDWCSNKTGKNSNIYNTSIPINRKSITMRFKASEDFELRTMRLSLVVARSENYLVVGPVPYVHLYAIQEDEKKDTRRIFLGELKRINDSGYLLFNSIVYAFNINKLNGRDFGNAIETLKHARELREFELVIGRPLFTTVDRTSPLINRSISAVNLSINFLSVEGFTHTKIDIQGVFKAKVQASFSKFLEIIFNSDNFVRPIDQYFDNVNGEQKSNVYELIESQLGPIMANFEENMAKLLLTLSEKNKRLADSIFSFLLKNVEKKPFFSLLIERIFKKTLFYRYLFDFVDFGRRKLMGDPTVLARFLAVLTNYLAFLITKLEQDGQQVAVALPIDEKFFNSVLAAHKQAPFTFQIERFVVFTISLLLEGKMHTNLPSTVAKSDTYHLPTELLKNEDSKVFGRQLLGILVDRIAGGETIFLHLLGSLINRCEEAKQAVITHKFIESIAERLQPKTVEATVEVMLFIQTASEDSSLYPLIISNGIDQRLIVLIEEWVQKKSFKDNIDLVNTVLKTVFSIFKHSQPQIDYLEQVLFGILKRNCNDSFFIEKILLKFFEFEFTRKTAFVVGRQSELPASKPKNQQSETGETVTQKAAPLQIKSTNMSSDRFNHLSTKLKHLVDEKTERLIRNFEWKRIVETSDDCEDFSPKFEPLMYQKRPLLILMTLDNSGTIGFLGLFVPEGFVKYTDQNDGVAYVPNSDNTFIFWYSENTFVHYKPALDHCDKFLKYVNFEGAKSMSLAIDDVDKIMISLSQETQSNIEIDQIKVIQSDNNPDFEFPYNCALNSIEIFQLEVKLDEKSEAVNEGSAELLAGKYVDKLGAIDVQGSMFGEAIFHELPEQLSLKALKSAVPVLILNEDLKERCLADFPGPRTILGVTKDVTSVQRTAYQTLYNPRFPIFEVFLSRGGIQYVIEKVKGNNDIPILKDKSQQENWRQLMDDLLELQCIDGFLSAMTQSKDFLPVIFELFIGNSKSTRNWEEAELAISNLMFEKLATILKNSDSLAMRFTFFEKNVLRKLLDKLRGLTFDLVRVYKEDEVAEPNAGPTTTSEPSPDKDEPLLKEVKKRKGVGYEKEGSGKKWIVTEYLAKKKVRNEFIVSLLKLFRNLFSLPLESYKPEDKKVEELRKSWFRTIAESSLLPMLEGAFKTSSLQEMSKESEVYEQLCDVLLTIGKQPELRPLMLQLPRQYKPVQLESMIQIIKKQEENTHLFKNFAQTGISKAAEGEEKLHSIELANLILDTIEKIKKMYPEQFDEGGDEEYENITDQDVSAIQELPVNEQYKIAFKNLRFDLVDFKKPNDKLYDHHYSSNIESDAKSSSPARMVRLAQEITDLSSSLPIDSYNAITVRADVNRLDVIKAIIAGAENTPYAHGLFEYHVYLPSEYPAGPPKCNLETTGNGDVRFNPNLYSCGKVCLSLLGTWRGSASENWDPKISNLLQLFLSIQSVVMSEEVYFNEPGYEGEAGTEEGEKKNEGYSNIVRINNIKHAMIKQIKTPPVGFEDVVRRHFYIKRHVILKEVGKWVKFAEVRPCSYSGLVSDHNNKYSSKFNNSKTYVSDLKSAIADLERALKELVLNSDPHHIFANKKLTHGRTKQKAKPKKNATVELKAIDEKVDTAWDDIKKSETFDANDKRVADRWSRYIGAMGIEAVKKQSTAKVAIVGLNVLGLEIAKNIVLSGVHTLTLVDWQTVSEKELLGNFYATQTDVGVNRAACVKSKIQQLNFYVKVEDVDLTAKPALDFVAEQTVLVITDNYLPQTRAMLDIAKDKKVKVIIAEIVGAYARIFVDFGASFVVNDRDGEDPSECYIKSIDQTTNTISLFDKSFNQLRDGDYIVISEAETGAAEGDHQQDLNESIHKIKQMKKVTEIEVEDLSKFRPYQRNGKIKELKVPLTHKFRDYSELSLSTFASFMDENLAIHDFMKLDAIQHVAQCFLLKERLEESTKVPFAQTALAKLIELANEEQKKDEKFMKRLSLFWATARGHLHSLDAFIGGMVSQEVIIGITGKFTPIKQLFCTDIEEVVCDELKSSPETLTEDQLAKMIQSKDRYGKLSFLVGEPLMKKLREARLFMVGAGAIGCELLKNCAMVGLGSGEQGSITLTDPDSIELSNLNRQFLFREKHISKPKSLVAASVVQSMNEDYKGHLVARLEKVCDDTEEVYNDQFIQRQSICLNALDNIKARVYMDQRCVKNHVPLLESGTLGPKGHVQVIVPGITENYAQVRDANEEHNIPVCTLKMFPEEAVHCMEWAKDRFEVLFSQNPKSVERVLEEFKTKGDVSAVYAKIKKAVLKLLKNRPKSQKEAVEAARRFYQKNFANKINQLMHVYPLDHKTKEGKLFWTLPKRPPVPRNFDLADPLDAKFIDSYARLLCRIWGLEEKLPEGEQLQKTLAEVPIEPFKPKDSDAAKIKKDVESMEKKEIAEPKDEKEPEQQENASGDETKLNSELNALLATLDVPALLKQVHAEVFEKDNDANNHIDVIYCLSALRSKNYKLAEMDWMTTKLKAGRIVPALATTTATIAALQTIEAIKLIKGNKVDELKNCFLNLAIPNMTLSEPGPAAKFKIHDSLTVTVWDRWTFDFTATSNNLFKDLINYIESAYKLHVVDVLKDNKPIFLSALNKRADFDKVPLADLLELEVGESCYLSMICKLTPESEKSVANLPLVKVAFK